jgi:CRISPR/Cas system-associated exonuclease Cas4 (RecB family)
MTKTLDTLVEDVYAIVEDESFTLSDELIDTFAQSMKDLLHRRFNGEPRVPHLSASNVGKPCKRQLWYSIHEADKERPLKAPTLLNFLYGDIIEELYMMLIQAAGHTVEGRQDEIMVEGVRGARDGVVDGVVVDVKSANGRSYSKFANHLVEHDDPFGYMAQLRTYLKGSENDPLVKDKSGAAFIAINKERGGLCVDYYEDDKFSDISKEVLKSKEIVNNDEPPERGFEPVADGKSGNMKLPVGCSYCGYNKTCWPEMRTFKYSNGWRHLVHVAREPDVHEVKDFV